MMITPQPPQWLQTPEFRDFHITSSIRGDRGHHLLVLFTVYYCSEAIGWIECDDTALRVLNIRHELIYKEDLDAVLHPHEHYDALVQRMLMLLLDDATRPAPSKVANIGQSPT